MVTLLYPSEATPPPLIGCIEKFPLAEVPPHVEAMPPHVEATALYTTRVLPSASAAALADMPGLRRVPHAVAIL